MKLLTCIIFFFPSLLLAQEKGIKFEQGRNWQQVQEKAKEENKFIFMDCYATWCGPCKSMDKDVYTKENVTNYMNAHFISVKVQFDTSANDPETVKKWYLDAHVITQQYKVNAFPTFIFFSPDGQVVYQASGGMTDSAFLVLAKQALEMGSQYYTLLKKYQAGELSYAALPKLGLMAANAKNQEMANRIAKDYLENYLDKLSKEQFFSTIDIEYMYQIINVLTSKDQVFKWMYSDPDKMDMAMQRKGITKSAVDEVIRKELINPVLWPNGKPIKSEPDWRKITFSIKEKYNQDDADRIVINTKVVWYYQKKNWPAVTKYLVQRIEQNAIDTTFWGRFYLNNDCYDIIFKHSNNKSELKKSIKWMSLVIEADSSDYVAIDTYANLLYKIGKVKEGIYWEEKAEKLNEEHALEKKRDPDKSYAQTVEKMKHGKPTW